MMKRVPSGKDVSLVIGSIAVNGTTKAWLGGRTLHTECSLRVNLAHGSVQSELSSGGRCIIDCPELLCLGDC